MPETITVAVATRARPASLARCLAALTSGHRVPDQLIVVDQSPSDRTREIVSELRFPRTQHLEQQHTGLSASRNLALSRARGAILAVTDDDCVVDCDWVRSILTAFAQRRSPAVVTGPILPLGRRPPGGHAVSSRPSRPRIDYRGKVLPWLAGSGGNFAGRTEVLRQYRGWDERLGSGSAGRAAEDIDLLYRLLRGGEVVRHDPAVLVAHEWQTLARRLVTRFTYGYGIGAFCGIWLRARDPFAVRMLTAFVALQGRSLASAAMHRDLRGVDDARRMLEGMLPGLAYGLKIGPRQPAGHAAPPRG